ncbi:MAG TPA: carboxymuconolactone decarboxylase family protein [Gemmatimonadaceae bacterium]|nr:carboxymuconolactone decarboxylase family protein [Gemmatimonadaceae bacterium]
MSAPAEGTGGRDAGRGVRRSGVRPGDDARDGAVRTRVGPDHILSVFDDGSDRLVRLSARVAGGDEESVRDALRACVGVAPADWVEEVLLQSYLFAGFPRALNAMRLWRAVSGRPAPAEDAEAAMPFEAWRQRGERTCAVVYGPFYERLRVNIAMLHPALDAWMIGEGYGKVLGRPMLDLARRELCVMAACVAAQQDRQLHSHLHGALHAGVAPDVVAAALEAALEAAAAWLAADAPRRYRQLWTKVQGKHARGG